jgi:hypothetical protein
MNPVETLPAEKATQRRVVLSWDLATTILWESVWNALVRAFIVQILGSIAIGLLSEVVGEMTPTLPPGFEHKPLAQAPPSPVLHAAGRFVSQNSFWIIFAVLYVGVAATQFAPFLRDSQHRRLAARLLRINRRVSGHWFRLLVLNAFTAWITAMVFVLVQQFSWTQILWNMIGDLVQPLVHAVASVVPGSGLLGRWFSWYGQNQGKFFFWLFYSAAICDDLGLPNYKTLLRWGASRLKRYAVARCSWKGDHG